MKRAVLLAVLLIAGFAISLAAFLLMAEAVLGRDPVTEGKFAVNHASRDV